MEKEINTLKIEFSKAKTEKEKENIRAKMRELKHKNEDAYFDGLIKSLDDTHQKVESLSQRVKERE